MSAKHRVSQIILLFGYRYRLHQVILGIQGESSCSMSVIKGKSCIFREYNRIVTIIWLELIILQELKNMVTLKKLKELKQIKRDNKVIYNLLNTIIGECEQISKDPSCSQVMDVIQKMYKDNKQTISECSVDRVDQLNTLNEENAFLESYLPQPLTKEELTALIGSQLTAGNNMSKIMKYLSEEYKGRYDGKVAVEIIKSLQ